MFQDHSKHSWRCSANVPVLSTCLVFSLSPHELVTFLIAVTKSQTEATEESAGICFAHHGRGGTVEFMGIGPRGLDPPAQLQGPGNRCREGRSQGEKLQAPHPTPIQWPTMCPQVLEKVHSTTSWEHEQKENCLGLQGYFTFKQDPGGGVGRGWSRLN